MADKALSWKIKSSRLVADCRVFRVSEEDCVREGDGSEANFFVLENPDWVNVIAVTREKEVVVIDQFRHGSGEITTEIPSGLIDNGELPIIAAKRELLEETGFSSDEWIELGVSRPNPALQNNSIFHFLALNCVKTDETSFDEHESIVTRTVPFEEVRWLIETGAISHSLAVAAFYYFDRKKIEL